jgi:hypothetical protein
MKYTGCRIEFEAVKLKMKNGHIYTPDFVVFAGSLILVEVKGGYKLPSHGRAMLALDQCRAEFPEFDFMLLFCDKGKVTQKEYQ